MLKSCFYQSKYLITKHEPHLWKYFREYKHSFFQGDDEDFLVDNEENLEPEVKPEPETVSKASKEYLGKLQYKVS